MGSWRTHNPEKNNLPEWDQDHSLLEKVLTHISIQDIGDCLKSVSLLHDKQHICLSALPGQRHYPIANHRPLVERVFVYSEIYAHRTKKSAQ
jgi:hypothetical protein